MYGEEAILFYKFNSFIINLKMKVEIFRFQQNSLEMFHFIPSCNTDQGVQVYGEYYSD